MKWLWVTLIQLLFTLFMYLMGSVFFGLAMVPGLGLLMKVWNLTADFNLFPRLFCLGFTMALGYFLFGLTLILVVGIFRTVFRIRLKEGTHPLQSFEAMKWAFTGSLYLMIHYTFIDFVLLTPFANLLFRMLGAKLGKNVQFNSKYVFDASLLEIGDNTVIGGGAIINGHIVERGKLVLRKVKIGENVTVGSHSTIMPGCTIGDRAIIGASAVLLKDTNVEPRDVWFGIPAESLREKKRQESRGRKQETGEGS
ncbi:MAG: DapH/DapD/GlmU-related protein [Candidatus Omnitrophota bacterium]